jgi:hypothetical protein
LARLIGQAALLQQAHPGHPLGQRQWQTVRSCVCRLRATARHVSAKLEAMRSPVYDVIIAGAGPVGLFLACELRLAKLSVLLLEQALDPDSPLKRLPFGMRGLWGPSVEAFYRRGAERSSAHCSEMETVCCWTSASRRR